MIININDFINHGYTIRKSTLENECIIYDAEKGHENLEKLPNFIYFIHRHKHIFINLLTNREFECVNTLCI